MSAHLTGETRFEYGAIHEVDFQRILVTCDKCGRTFVFHASRPNPKCNSCGYEVRFESRQTGPRPHVLLGEESCLADHDTVVAVPFSTTEFARLQPFAVEIEPSEENGLERKSYVLPTKVRCINKTSVFRGEPPGAPVRGGPEEGRGGSPEGNLRGPGIARAATSPLSTSPSPARCCGSSHR